jgi:hypothetical protein
MPGPWDLQFDRLVVELDEERHFNRYRAITLKADIYEELLLPTAEYREFCDRHERDCLAAAGWRGNWTNLSAESEFGPAGPERQLDGPGSPRWKQRAFYDFVKDLAPLCLDMQLARLSIWETINVAGEALLLGAALADSQAQTPDTARKLGSLVQGRGGQQAA